MKKKFILSDTQKICILFTVLIIALVISLSLCCISSNINTEKYYKNYELPKMTIKNQIVNFIELTNTLTTDRDAMNNAVVKTYHTLTDKSAAKFSKLAKENKLYDNFGRETKEVHINKNPIEIYPNTYQVEYEVITRYISGLILNSVHYLTTVITKVLDTCEDDREDNPLGIYIVDFDVKKIYENEEL